MIIVLVIQHCRALLFSVVGITTPLPWWCGKFQGAIICKAFQAELGMQATQNKYKRLFLTVLSTWQCDAYVNNARLYVLKHLCKYFPHIIITKVVLVTCVESLYTVVYTQTQILDTECGWWQENWLGTAPGKSFAKSEDLSLHLKCIRMKAQNINVSRNQII